MKYTGFYLQNFRGISDELILNVSNDRNKPYCIIGDNEAGKTTILKGIEVIGRLCKGETLSSEEVTALRPHITSFSGEMLLGALIQDNDTGYKIGFFYTFKDSKFVKSATIIYEQGELVSSSKKIQIRNKIRKHIPDVVYYDDFDFDVPEQITFRLGAQLEESGLNKLIISEENKRWQLIFDDLLRCALDSDSHEKISFKTHIVDVLEDEKLVNARIAAMEYTLDKRVGDRWNHVTGESKRFNNFRIQLKEWDNAVDLAIHVTADGSMYPVSMRSKGFKWFFCFVLMTEMRRWRSPNGVFLLLDEPANNIFFVRQAIVFDSILKSTTTHEKKGAQLDNLIYTTHSVGLIDKENTILLCSTNNKKEEFSTNNITLSTDLNENCEKLSIINQFQTVLAHGSKKIAGKLLEKSADIGLEKFLTKILGLQ